MLLMMMKKIKKMKMKMKKIVVVHYYQVDWMNLIDFPSPFPDYLDVQ